MKKYLFPIILFSFLIISSLLSACSERKTGYWAFPNKELRELDKTIDDAAKYKLKSDLFTDSLRKIAARTSTSESTRLNIYLELSDYYRPRQADSALIYARKAMLLSRQRDVRDEILQSTFLEIEALSASGLFSAAVLAYDSIPTDNLSPEIKMDYWIVGRHLYSNICNYVGEELDPSYNEYHDKLDICIDSIIRFTSLDSPYRIFTINERLVNHGKDTEARRGLDSLLNTCTKGDNLYGMVAYQIAQTYRKSDPTDFAAYLALAAESDIIGAVCDGYALPTLSAWLYEHGDLDKAFNYINFALNEAYEGNARMRIVNLSKWLPSIDQAYRQDLKEKRNEFATFAIVIIICVIGLIIALAYLTREMKRRRKYHAKIASVSKIKDQYIGNFIRLCSVYSEKYDSLNKTVIRKLTAGQSQDLLKLVKYGKTSETENEEFYKTIDGVFLQIYPDFIEKINLLLKPEERFEIDKESKILTPELRIYGFVRLGVTESAKIARILNYSSNTVYAYRNRMRKRAINHETFDSDVVSIDLDDQE